MDRMEKITDMIATIMLGLLIIFITIYGDYSFIQILPDIEPTIDKLILGILILMANILVVIFFIVMFRGRE